MRWADLKVGDFVRGTAEDFYQCEPDWRPEEIGEYEPIFDFEGRVHYISQRKLVVDGWWRWIEDTKYTPDDPQETRGIFGMRRKNVDALVKLEDGQVVEL